MLLFSSTQQISRYVGIRWYCQIEGHSAVEWGGVLAVRMDDEGDPSVWESFCMVTTRAYTGTKPQ